MRPSSILAVTGGALLVGAGGLGAAALAAGTSAPAPTRTVTVNVATGPQGPAGPPGPKGDTGPAGPAGLDCLTGYSPNILRINQPGGHVDVYTCVSDSS